MSLDAPDKFLGKIILNSTIKSPRLIGIFGSGNPSPEKRLVSPG